MLEGVIPLETFPLVEWHYGELADVPSFTVLKTQICVTRPQCVKLRGSKENNAGRKHDVEWSENLKGRENRVNVQISIVSEFFYYSAKLFQITLTHCISRFMKSSKSFSVFDS